MTTFKNGAEIFSQIIEVLKCEVEDVDTREVIYEEFIKIWKEHGCNELDVCLMEDPVFDKIFEVDEIEDDGKYYDTWNEDDI